MVCVDNSVADLVAGYDRIQQGENDVRAAQDRRRNQAQQAQATARQMQAAWNTKCSQTTPGIALGVEGGVIVASLAAFAVMLVSPATWVAHFLPCLAGLILCGVVIVVVGAVAWLGRVGLRPGVPAMPTFAAPALLEHWRAAMSRTLSPPKEDDEDDNNPEPAGYRGEYRCVTSFAALNTVSAFPPYILHSVQTAPRDDLDVVIVDERGVWLFEVKYWAGRVTYNTGHWSHVKVNKYTQVETAQVHAQWPDAQWLRMRELIRSTLSRRAPGVVTRYPRILDIQGGIAFTHTGARLEIGSSIPVETGRLEDWLIMYPTRPGPVTLDERTALEVVQALLDWHTQLVAQEAGAPVTRCSMKDEADRLIAKALA